MFSYNEEFFNIAVFLSLPFLIGAPISRGKKTKIQWRGSKQEMRDGFITHVRSNAVVQTTITHRREKLVGCETVWCFIQKGFFKLQTLFDKNFTVVNTFLSDVGM